MNINKNGKTGLTETDAEERTPSLQTVCACAYNCVHPIACACVLLAGEDGPSNDLRRPWSVYGSCVCVDRCVCVVWPARHRRYVCMRYMH